MRIIIDADAVPAAVKEVLFRASARLNIPLVFVANNYQFLPKSELNKMVVVSSGLDKADDFIAETVCAGELVITADIPLAARVIEKEAFALNPRGFLYTAQNVGEKLSLRNFMDEIRGFGTDTGGPAPYSVKHKEAFAKELDKFLNSHRN